MAATRRSTVTWEGDLAHGSGRVSAATSGLYTDLPVSWASRIGNPEGRTSPEELLASAHASCFAMALSNTLAQGNTPPQRLQVESAVTFDLTNAGPRVASSALTVRGTVPGIDAAGFQRAAETAKDNCPISKALQGNVQLSVEATLEA
ncbi:MAG TPA: OsmC family peroxiredoxin [Ktedonobacterales bacterium]